MWYNQINKRFVKIIRFDNEEDVTVIDESNLNLSPSLSLFLFLFIYIFFIDDIDRRHRGWGKKEWEDKTYNTSNYKRA